jgi:hypothetical protein
MLLPSRISHLPFLLHLSQHPIRRPKRLKSRGHPTICTIQQSAFSFSLSYTSQPPFKNSPSLQQRLPNLHFRAAIPNRPSNMHPQLRRLPQRRQHHQVQQTPRLELQPRTRPDGTPCELCFASASDVISSSPPPPLSNPIQIPETAAMHG